MKRWDFEDEFYNHYYCDAPTKSEARKEARKVLERNRQWNSGKQVINLRRNPQDEFEEWMKREAAK